MSKKLKEKNIIYEIKIIIIGKSGSGKTSFVNRWINDSFSQDYKSTIISEYSSKIYKYNKKNYKINLWDIAGQDHFASLVKAFSKDAQGCITMADIMDENSLNETLKWKQALDENQNFPTGDIIPNILVLNKVDLVSEEEANDMTKLEEFSQNNDFDGCFKTSAKTGKNIKEAMDKLIELVIKRIDEMNSKDINIFRNSLALDPAKVKDLEESQETQEKCC